MESSDDESRLICGGGDDDDDDVDQVVDEDSYVQKIDDDRDTRDEKDYFVLIEVDIRRRQDNAIAAVRSVLSVSKSAACLLLRRHNWSPPDVYDAWFADEGRTRNAVGLPPENSTPRIQSLSACGICFECYPPERVRSAGCGHPFCETCWGLYIGTAVGDGPGCLSLRCPEPSCGGAAVGLDMIESLASADDKNRYDRFLLRSYIEENKKCKWCPAPGCAYAVEYSFDSDSSDHTVTCKCSYRFCWNCSEESHRPLNCETVAKWAKKNSCESDSTRWILAFTKPCPKCKRPIEKNNGCNHMTCTPPCRFQFCWLCLNNWQGHSYNSCNAYKATEGSGSVQETARMLLMKYTHYYERWTSNEKSKQKAMLDLKLIKDKHTKEALDPSCEIDKMIEVVIAAWERIIDCRRILKWSYVYGYYLLEEEVGKKQLFEYLQGQSESALERLHHCAEGGLEKYLRKGYSSKTFNGYRLKLKGLTNSTRKYFDNLAKAFENGLCEVDACAGSDARLVKCGRKRANCEI